ncbi:unnamed protein product [Didymodactylos carnosus]|uniref:TIR domain-containing protein n=1 Tax=Didymodactylos carnosus TaxID=1234261 RepID=A0A815FUS3_9BILA|nr:unnamed protein product [Didymodactylos carnosus]CAF1330473.1 unnamed protein product [Didymodactylos carnosus]CAF3800999.1 unnamed protein product [Didymodactylos carnosus]CAF4183503.1 unnamed protein product [Didymodactylos carnosus]
MGVICLITNCCLNSEIIKSFQIDNEYSEAMSNILNYKEFQQKVKSEWINDETILINMVIQCLTNCCRSDNNEIIRTVLREKKIISSCLTLTQICRDDNLGIRTSLLLAELLNDSDLNATSIDVINDLINDYFTYLIRAFNSTTQSYHHIDILLLLKGLLLFCKNDIIQDLISKTDNIKILIEMSIQYPIMYDILWTLSFHSNIQIQLKNDKAFVNTIKRLKDDKTVSGILWNLGLEQDSINKKKHQKRSQPLSSGISRPVTKSSSIFNEEVGEENQSSLYQELTDVEMKTDIQSTSINSSVTFPGHSPSPAAPPPPPSSPAVLATNSSHNFPRFRSRHPSADFEQAEFSPSTKKESIQLETNVDNVNVLNHKFDLMISYSHSEKELCQRVKDSLNTSGYRVWVDYEQMSGNMMDSMATAIESTNCILLFMSENYKRSNYCRAEAQYAFKRNLIIIPVLIQRSYKADGWLGLIVGSLLYIDFTKYEFQQAYNMLIREIKQAKHIITENTSNEHITPIISSPNIQKQYLNKEVKKWTNTDIVHWCEDYNLMIFSKILSNFDGNSLIQLHLLCKTNSNQIIDLLQNDSKKLGYDLSILELARFQSQLEKIILEKDENRKKTTLSIKSPTISTSNRVSKTCLIL